MENNENRSGDNSEPLTQSIMIALSLGSRKPQNEKEQRVLDEINAANAKGIGMDLPFE
jgi:hypothetical protein